MNEEQPKDDPSIINTEHVGDIDKLKDVLPDDCFITEEEFIHQWRQAWGIGVMDAEGATKLSSLILEHAILLRQLKIMSGDREPHEVAFDAIPKSFVKTADYAMENNCSIEEAARKIGKNVADHGKLPPRKANEPKQSFTDRLLFGRDN